MEGHPHRAGGPLSTNVGDGAAAWAVIEVYVYKSYNSKETVLPSCSESNAVPIRLPRANQTVVEGTIARFSGWGRTTKTREGGDTVTLQVRSKI